MYIIRGDIGGATYNFPAEQCFWQTGASADGGYAITAAFLLPQFAAVSINGESSAEGHIPIGNAELGYIGKSGRFVAITN